MKDLNIVARVPLKDLKIKEPKVGIRTPQVLCTSDYQGFLRGDILDANSVYSLVEDLHVPDVEEINKRLKGVAYQDKSNTFAEENIFNKKVTFNSDTELNGTMYINAPNASLIFSGDTARLENVKGIKGVSGDVSNTKVFNTNGSVVDTSKFLDVTKKTLIKPESANVYLYTLGKSEDTAIKITYSNTTDYSSHIEIGNIDINSDGIYGKNIQLTSSFAGIIQNVEDKRYILGSTYEGYVGILTNPGGGSSTIINALSKEGLKVLNKTVKDIPSCQESFIHIGDTDDATPYTQVAPITNGKIPSRYIDTTNLVKLTDGKIDSNYLPASIVDSNKLNNTVQRLFINGGDGQYLRTESIADVNKYYATDGSIQSITDKIAEYMTAHPSSSSSNVGLSYNNTFTGEINTFKGRVALGSDSGVVNLKGVNSNDFKGLELGIYDNAKCGIKTHNGDSYEYYATDGSLQSITTQIANYLKVNPASASVTAPTELSASASQDTIIAKINELITALITAGIFKNA